MSTVVVSSNPLGRCRVFAPQSDPGPINRLPHSLISYLLSFVLIRNTHSFKRTCHPYRNISRIDVSLSISYQNLKALPSIDRYIKRTRDVVRRLVIEFDGPNFAFGRMSSYVPLQFCAKIQLAYLKIGQIWLSDADMIELSKITTLKTLHLGKHRCFQTRLNEISDAGLKAISTLQLTTFSLMDASRITPIGLSYLSKMPLENLTLTKCYPFSRDALGPLQKLPLHTLDMGIGVSRHDIAWLTASIPTLKRVNARKVKEEVFTSAIWRMFREVILGFLEHPQDDQNLRETASFFRLLYPRHVNLILTPYVGVCTAPAFDSRKRINFFQLKQLINLYKKNTGKIHRIEAIVDDHFQSQEHILAIPSLKKLKLELSGVANPRDLFSDLKRTSLDELCLDGYFLSHIPEEDWSELESLHLTSLALTNFSTRNTVIAQYAFMSFDRMPIKRLMLSSQDSTALAFYMAQIKKFPLEELEFLPLPYGHATEHPAWYWFDSTFQVLAQLIPTLSMVNGRTINRQSDPPAIDLAIPKEHPAITEQNRNIHSRPIAKKTINFFTEKLARRDENVSDEWIHKIPDPLPQRNTSQSQGMPLAVDGALAEPLPLPQDPTQIVQSTASTAPHTEPENQIQLNGSNPVNQTQTTELTQVNPSHAPNDELRSTSPLPPQPVQAQVHGLSYHLREFCSAIGRAFACLFAWLGGLCARFSSNA